MNERLQGVFVYGGGPQNHYVFRGEAQRRRRTRNITILLAAILALLILWFARTTVAEVVQPQHATADQATPAAQVETTSETYSAVLSNGGEADAAV